MSVTNIRTNTHTHTHTRTHTPLSIRYEHPVETVTEMMLLPVVASRTEFIVVALGTLPTDAIYWLQPAVVTHRSTVLNSCCE